MTNAPTDSGPESGDDAEMKRVGATIKALREAYGLSVPQLAAAVEVDKRHIYYIEDGTKRATPQVCRKIADTLGVPLAAITVKNYAQIAEAAQ